MTDDAPKTTDPLDGLPDLRPKEGATREQIALAAYDAVGLMMRALAGRAEDTAAKNYVGIKFEGISLPFDRAEIQFVRPGGLAPSERAERLQVIVDELREKVRSMGTLKEELRILRDENRQFIAANVEIAVELTDRITGGTPIDTEERFLKVLNAAQQSASALRARNRILETERVATVEALLAAHRALAGDLDHGKALDAIAVALTGLGAMP